MATEMDDGWKQFYFGNLKTREKRRKARACRERPVSGRERKRQKPAFAELPPPLRSFGGRVGEAKPESGKRLEGERIAAALTRAVQGRVTDSGGPAGVGS